MAPSPAASLMRRSEAAALLPRWLRSARLLASPARAQLRVAHRVGLCARAGTPTSTPAAMLGTATHF
eukprot:1471101-Alexandrium_andersonii.AAC.1